MSEKNKHCIGLEDLIGHEIHTSGFLADNEAILFTNKLYVPVNYLPSPDEAIMAWWMRCISGGLIIRDMRSPANFKGVSK